MAIEPLGSMTAIQVQSTKKVQSMEPRERQDVKNMDVNVPDSATPKMDATTAVVARTSENNGASDERGRENTKENPELIKKSIDSLNRNINQNTEAVFGIHEGTNRVTIKIVDRQTKEIIKELPPEKTLDMIERVWELAGILVDEKR